MSAKLYDVIIIGSGPAGSTAATLLADQGHSVLMIERDKHPRFHIGESLLPLGQPVFQRLGIEWDSKEYLPKGGAEFIDEASNQSADFPLAGQHQPYQIERAPFDLMMVNNAIAKGADYKDEEKVITFNITPEQVDVKTDKGEYQSRYLIDATGRSSLSGRMNRSIERISKLGKFSHYTHFRNVDPDADIFKTGNIKILMVDIGWIWVIPLVNNRLSVGIVVQSELTPDERGPQLFDKYVAKSAILHELLEDAEQETPVRTEADFSFTNTKRFGSRFASCGDASGFLDPVFSSGVFLAVTSAERVSDRLHEALINGTEADPDLHATGDDDYYFGFKSMLLFIERFYKNDIVHHLFFQSNRDEKVKNDIMGILSGDLWTGNNAFQKALIDGHEKRNPSKAAS